MNEPNRPGKTVSQAVCAIGEIAFQVSVMALNTALEAASAEGLVPVQADGRAALGVRRLLDDCIAQSGWSGPDRLALTECAGKIAGPSAAVPGSPVETHSFSQGLWALVDGLDGLSDDPGAAPPLVRPFAPEEEPVLAATPGRASFPVDRDAS